MKILLTTILFLPEHFAGTEILTYSTAKELQLVGHDVHVLTGFCGEKDLPDELRFDSYEYDGIPVSRFHHADVPMGEEWDTMKMEYDNRFVADWFRSFLKKNRPDIVHFFHLARLSTSLIEVCSEMGVPMVLTPTDFWYVCPISQLRLQDHSICPGPDRLAVNCIRHLDYLDKPQEMTIVKKSPDWFIAFVVLLAKLGVLPRKRFGFVYAMSERSALLMKRLNSVGRVMVPSAIMEQVLVKHGLKKELKIFSAFGLNLETIPENMVREESDVLRIGFIGAFYEHKGLPVLLKAVNLMHQDLKFTLQIYGENKDQPEFLAYLKKLAGADPRIAFCGTFPNSEIGSVLAKIDVLVVPSVWYENTPLVIYSAMAAKCPVVCSDLGGMSEVVHHMHNGMLVKAGDEFELAKALDLLCRDRKLLAQLSSGCKRPKSIKEYVAEALNVYSEILKLA